MTDQTAHDVTNEERMLARKWAKSIESRTETWTACTRAAVRVILDAVPTPPTLKDMTEEERAACQWMQADVKGVDSRAVIVNPYWVGAIARVMWPDTRMGSVTWERITPRPDLPRMEWPGTEKPAPAPALPDGWRLADHRKYGRVIVTNPTPNRDGRVYFVIPAADPLGYDLLFGPADKLTYLDQEADQ